jgi:hypothetical protein
VDVKKKKKRLYRARVFAKEKIRGKVNLQYQKLWDYCETIRRTNIGSCVMMKLERPIPDLPAKFQRFLSNLGKGPAKGWTFIFYRQKVTLQCLFHSFNYSLL